MSTGREVTDPKTHPPPHPLPEGPLLWVRPSVVGPAFPVPAEELQDSSVGRLGVVSQEKLTLRLTRHWFRSVAQAALQEAQRVEKPSKAKARAGLCPLQDGAGRAERLGRFQTPPSRLPHPQQPCSTCWSGVGRNPPALPPSCPETRTGAETAWS